MTRRAFFRGLLYALRERREGFLAEGPAFQAAFRSTLEEAVNVPAFVEVAEPLLENFDPVFGVFPDATSMLLEGLEALILAFEGAHCCTVRFTLSELDAREELALLPHTEGFRTLARVFSQNLA